MAVAVVAVTVVLTVLLVAPGKLGEVDRAAAAAAAALRAANKLRAGFGAELEGAALGIRTLRTVLTVTVSEPRGLPKPKSVSLWGVTVIDSRKRKQCQCVCPVFRCLQSVNLTGRVLSESVAKAIQKRCESVARTWRAGAGCGF